MHEGVMELVTPPTAEPVWLDDVTKHCRIGIAEDNILIQEKIVGIRLMVERNRDLAFITQTWSLKLSYFPPEIRIYKWPVQSITKIEYLVSGVLTTLSSSIYVTDLKRRPPIVYPAAPYQSWPTLSEVRPGAVVVTFKAGYGDTAASVPQHVKQYLLYRIADAYENRETYTTENRTANDFVENLIASEALRSM